jgi:nucleoside-diphosphate-sugar epimerase
LANILLIGCTGNIGTLVFEKLLKVGHNVRCVKRTSNKDSDSLVIPYQGITNVKDFEPKIIINLANYYTQDRQADFLRMQDSTLGIASAIANQNLKWKAKIIHTSSYFQYCPMEMRPWSKYAELKTKSLITLEESCKINNVNLINFILYDNYGGKNKSKFFDLLIKSTALEQNLHATFGEQVLNLINIENIVAAIIYECNNNFQRNTSQTLNYDLRSNFTSSLLDLSKLVCSVLNAESRVIWGSKLYRDKEVFKLWDSEFESPDYWDSKNDIHEYITEQAHQYRSKMYSRIRKFHNNL